MDGHTFMSISNIFSKRQKKLRGEVPDVYTYDKIPEPVILVWPKPQPAWMKALFQSFQSSCPKGGNH